MEVNILNIRDSLERLIYLKTQERITVEFSPLDFSGIEGSRIIALYGKDSFDKACQAYQIRKEDIEVSDTDSEDWIRKSFKVRDFQITCHMRREDDVDE